MRAFWSPLQRVKESFLSPVKTGSQIRGIAWPTLQKRGLRFLRRLRRRCRCRWLSGIECATICSVRPLKKIPTFAAEDEEREFWSRADSTEYVDWSKAKEHPLPRL